jgi:hypothetical protein
MISCLVLYAMDESAELAPLSGERTAQEGPPSEGPPADQPAKPLTEQSYVGANQCFQCHRPHTNSWSETKHEKAFTNLPERYRDDASCLKCHVTGYGQERGFAAGTDKDLLSVGCEACHGPGALHLDAAQRYILAPAGEEAKIEKEMRDTIVKTPSDSVCINCHNTQAHGRHPPYQGRSAKLAADSSQPHSALRPTFLQTSSAPAWHFAGYSVKTCGSCHYDQYKQWGSEAHSSLFAVLPQKYYGNQECATCHLPSAMSKTSTKPGESSPDRIGAACETCHGPGLNHVRLTKRFITTSRLGPQLEQQVRQSILQGKPAATCIACHAAIGHKEHPAYEK